MADDKIVELPERDNTPTPHVESNVEPRKDTGRIDLSPKPTLSPDVATPPEPEPKPEPPKESPDAPDDDLESLKRKRKELEEDNFKYRQERKELRSRLENLEANVSHVTGDREFDEASKKVQTELGIDEESAKKLTRAFREINKSKSESLNPVQKAAQDFQSQASEAMDDFPDWDVHKKRMTELLESDIRSSGELKALKRGPLYYYSESRRMSLDDTESAKAQGRKEMAEKVNQKNLSVSESSRNSQGKPSIQSKWTKENIQDLARNNPVEYDKRRSEIHRAMVNGEIQ